MNNEQLKLIIMAIEKSALEVSVDVLQLQKSLMLGTYQGSEISEFAKRLSLKETLLDHITKELRGELAKYGSIKGHKGIGGQ